MFNLKNRQHNPNLTLDQTVDCKIESRMKISTMRLCALYIFFYYYFAEFRTSRATFEPQILFPWRGLCCSFQLRFQLPSSYTGVEYLKFSLLLNTFNSAEMNNAYRIGALPLPLTEVQESLRAAFNCDRPLLAFLS